MATTSTGTGTPTKTAANTATKAARPAVNLVQRITAQLDRAVLNKKITKEELARLSAHVARLDAFLA